MRTIRRLVASIMTRSVRHARTLRRAQPRLEVLELRDVPATFIIDNYTTTQLITATGTPVVVQTGFVDAGAGIVGGQREAVVTKLTGNAGAAVNLRVDASGATLDTGLGSTGQLLIAYDGSSDAGATGVNISGLGGIDFGSTASRFEVLAGTDLSGAGVQLQITVYTFNGSTYVPSSVAKNVPVNTLDTVIFNFSEFAGADFTNIGAITLEIINSPPAADTTVLLFCATGVSDLSLTKSVSDTAPALGDIVTYTVTLTNDGSNGVGGITVTDAIPAGVQFLATQAGTTGTFDGTTWTPGGTLASGASVQLVYTARITATGTLTNTAQVATADNADPDSTPGNGVGTEDDQASVTVNGQPVDMGDAPTSAQSGFAASYPTTIADNGARHIATGPTLGATRDTESDGQPTANADGDGGDEDGVTLPAGLARGTTQNIVVNVSGSGFLNAWFDFNQDGDWDDANEQVLTNAAVVAGNNTVAITLPAGATLGTTFARFRLTQASVVGAAPTGVLPTGEVEDYQVSIVEPADIALDKTVDNATPALGTNVTFTVTATNNGPGAATGVTVNDLLPAGFAFVSFTATGTTTYDSGTGVWTIGNLAIGATETLTLTATVVASGTSTNTATLATVTPGDTNPDNDTDSASVTVQGTDFGDAPDTYGTLLANNGARHIDTGPTLGATRDSENDGQPNAAATGDGADEDGVTLPVGGLVIGVNNTVTFTGTAGALVNAWVDFNRDGDFTDAGEQILTDVVATGVTQTITVAVPAGAVAGQSYARFRISTVGGLSPTGSALDGEVEDYAVTLGNQADLQLTKTVDDSTPAIGDTVTFTLTLTNSGPSDATGVTIRDVLPAGLTYVNDTGAGAFDSATGTWTVGTLANGATATLQITAQVTAGGSIVNYTQVFTSNEIDPNSTPGNTSSGEDDDDTVTLSVAAPDLQIVKTVLNTDTSVDAGTAVTYRVVISHTGASTGDAFSVQLNDALAGAGLTLNPGSITLVSVPAYTNTANASDLTGLDLNFSELRLGDSITVEYTATLNGPATAMGTIPAPGSTVTNTATINYRPASTSTAVFTTQDDAQITVNTYSLSGAVYFDANNDGTQQLATEPLITGQTITLQLIGTDAEGNAVNLTTTTTTGLYSFTGLRPGTYRVVEVGQPTGYLDGTDTAGTPFGGTGSAPSATGKTDATLGAVGGLITGIVIPVNADQDGVANTGITYNFGELLAASIGDFVWLDSNGNGRQDGGTEVGIGGVTVTLTGTDDLGAITPITTTTSGAGAYLFANLRPGTYVVTFGDTDGTTTYRRTVLNSPVATTSSDSDANPVTGATASITLGAGQNNADIDAGLFTLGSLGDTVWFDLNNNGTQDTGEPGIAGVTVTLVSAGLDGLFGTPDDPAAIDVATTDANGNYTFINVTPGVYRVSVDAATLPVGLTTQTFDLDDGTGPFATANAAIVSIASGQNRTDADFGYRGTGSLGDTVWHDLDRDGTQDMGEPGLAGVTVTLVWAGRDGDLATTADNFTFPAQVTDSSGQYLFANLPAGQFRVAVDTATLPAGLTSPTFDLDSGTTNPDGTTVATLTDGQARTDADFGFSGTGSIGDRLWLDSDGDGVQDAGEPGMPAGIQVQLTWAGADGDLATTADNVVYTTTTGANGAYGFSNLPAGNFLVQVVTATVPAGVALSGDPDATLDGQTAITLTSGQQVTTADFGYRGTATLGGFVYVDLNDDGVFQSATEPPLPGVTITLLGTDAFGNSVSAQTTTGTDGSYSFTNLVPGTYRLTETQPNRSDGQDTLGTVDGTPSGLASNDVFAGIVIGPGSVGVNYNFGEGGATLSGLVFYDADRDGTLDTGETPIAGVTITLTDSTGTVVGTTTTATDGTYLFENLSDGDYTITETQPTGYGNPPSGPFAPDTRAVTITGGVPVTDQNFGDTLGSISGFVYLDFNLDTTFTTPTPDTGLGGITITLLDGTGTTVATTTSAADGSYSFTGLLPGTYTVVETQPGLPTTLTNGYYDGADNLGSLSGTNTTKNSITLTLGVDATSGLSPTATGYNFGELPPADPFGFVYVDQNRNGVRDTGEPGIAGVSITISGTAFAGTPFARPLVASDIPGGSLTVLTDANGRWEFVPIPPGLYAITETQPAGFADGQEQNADTAGPNTVVIGNDSFSNILLAPQPIRGPFNFGELQALPAPGTLPPLNFFPSLGSVTGSKRALLGSALNSSGGGVPTLPTQPNFNAFSPSTSRPIVFSAAASGGLVRVFDFSSGNERFRFRPFGNRYTGSIRVATGDVNGDGVPDIIVARGPGGPTVIKVFDGITGGMIRMIRPFGNNYTKGATVAAADINGDGQAEIIVGSGAGSAVVKVFNGATGQQTARFVAFNGYKGGVRVAAGDVNSDGIGDIVVSTATGRGKVAGFSGANLDSTPNRIFAAFMPMTGTKGGVWVAAGDANGDSFADVIVGAGNGQAPQVMVFSGSSLSGGGRGRIGSFRAGTATRSVRVGAADADGDGRVEVLAAFGPGTFPTMSIYNALSGANRSQFYAFPTNYLTGVEVG